MGYGLYEVWVEGVYDELVVYAAGGPADGEGGLYDWDGVEL